MVGMIFLTALLVLGAFAGLKPVVKGETKPFELNRETIDQLGILYWVCIFVPAATTIWAAILIESEIIFFIVGSYIAWNLIDTNHFFQQVRKALEEGKTVYTHKLSLIEKFTGILEVALLSYLIWCLYWVI